MNDTQIRRKVIDLAQRVCASNESGYCIDYDKPCFAYDDRWSVHDGAMNCDYFNAAVLPTDKVLAAAVWAEIDRDAETGEVSRPLTAVQQKAPAQKKRTTYESKRCAACGKVFLPASSRAAYCSEACKAFGKRTKDAQRQQKKRAGDVTLLSRF